MYQKMMSKKFEIKAIAFIFSVSEESIKKLLMKAQKMHYKTGENMNKNTLREGLANERIF